MSRARGWVWLQLLIGWLPIWALYATLIVTAHRDTTPQGAALIAFRAILIAAALGLVVQRLTERVPWPHPFRPRFLATHALAALLYSVSWTGLTILSETAVHRPGVLIFHYAPAGYLVLGIWLYAMVAGVSYATEATRRAAEAEAMAARSQLAALRAQLNPHFLFNALHTVVQLIPREPRRATQAAEQLAGLLRTTIEEDRDLVSLAEEWAFAERYLEVERLRFGDRLQVRVEVTDEAAGAMIPSFALQTLVENAVRHGAAPRVETTEIAVEGRTAGDLLTVTVRDTGAGSEVEQLGRTDGTGLKRLRDRLAVLYGSRARLDLATGAGGGFTATLRIPLNAAE